MLFRTHTFAYRARRDEVAKEMVEGLHAFTAASNELTRRRAKEADMRQKLKEGRAELRQKTIEAEEIAKDADARAETEAELRKFTEWKMRAKMQESKKRWAGEQYSGRREQLQFQQDKMTEMVRSQGNGRPTSAMSMPGPGPMASGGGYTPTGGGRPKSAAAIVQNISSRMVRALVYPQLLLKTFVVLFQRAPPPPPTLDEC